MIRTVCAATNSAKSDEHDQRRSARLPSGYLPHGLGHERGGAPDLDDVDAGAGLDGRVLVVGARGPDLAVELDATPTPSSFAMRSRTIAERPTARRCRCGSAAACSRWRARDRPHEAAAAGRELTSEDGDRDGAARPREPSQRRRPGRRPRTGPGRSPWSSSPRRRATTASDEPEHPGIHRDGLTGRAGSVTPAQPGARAKSSASNGRRSSSASPIPISLTGMPSSPAIASAMPPLAVPSSLVRTMPSTGTASENSLAWRRPFWPVVASTVSSVSCGAPGICLAITRRTLVSSAIRSSWVCRRPAVSMITTSAPRSRPCLTASKATEPGIRALGAA